VRHLSYTLPAIIVEYSLFGRAGILLVAGSVLFDQLVFGSYRVSWIVLACSLVWLYTVSRLHMIVDTVMAVKPGLRTCRGAVGFVRALFTPWRLTPPLTSVRTPTTPTTNIATPTDPLPCHGKAAPPPLPPAPDADPFTYTFDAATKLTSRTRGQLAVTQGVPLSGPTAPTARAVRSQQSAFATLGACLATSGLAAQLPLPPSAFASPPPVLSTKPNRRTHTRRPRRRRRPPRRPTHRARPLIRAATGRRGAPKTAHAARHRPQLTRPRVLMHLHPAHVHASRSPTSPTPSRWHSYQ
jgi:hypothetical protein